MLVLYHENIFWTVEYEQSSVNHILKRATIKGNNMLLIYREHIIPLISALWEYKLISMGHEIRPKFNYANMLGVF